VAPLRPTTRATSQVIGAQVALATSYSR
jgi:hypothetical protein